MTSRSCERSVRGEATPTLTHTWLQARPKLPHCYSGYFYPPLVCRVSTVAFFFLLIPRKRELLKSFLKPKRTILYPLSTSSPPSFVLISRPLELIGAKNTETLKLQSAHGGCMSGNTSAAPDVVLLNKMFGNEQTWAQQTDLKINDCGELDPQGDRVYQSNISSMNIQREILKVMQCT